MTKTKKKDTEQMAEIKTGTKLSCGVVLSIHPDGVMFDHIKNPEPIKLSFHAIALMAANDKGENSD